MPALAENEVEYERVSIGGMAIDDPKMAGAVADVLDLRLSGFAARAWKDYDRVRAALAKTRANAPDRERIELARHEITTSCPLVIEADIGGGVRRKLVDGELGLRFEIDPVALLIVDGEIEPIEGGGKVEGTVTLGGVVLRKKQLAQVDLGTIVGSRDSTTEPELVVDLTVRPPEPEPVATPPPPPSPPPAS